MNGRYIEIEALSGTKFRGYLSTPVSGQGPGVVLCQEIYGVNATMRAVADYYAEEGYSVLVPDLYWRLEPGIELGYTEEDHARAFDLYGRFDEADGVRDVDASLRALRARPECTGAMGVLGFCLGGKLAYLAACRLPRIAAAVSYYGVGIEAALDEAVEFRGRLVLHIAGQDQFCAVSAQERIRAALADRPGVEIYVYPGVDHAFARSDDRHWNKPAAFMAHQRSVAVFRAEMGPYYNLSALWDKHVEYEFSTRDVDATMQTMVAEPYVNHIPTMTGGVGHDELKRFYRHHFVHSNPPDTVTIPISRTVGATQIVDEMLFCFTHTTEIDWMLPGIAPTGKRVEVPLIAIVKFRGDKLYHEHIYWDQASVLAQIGLLDNHALPVAGVEATEKLLNEELPSNALMASWPASVGLAS